MVVARSCRRRRSLALRSSSPARLLPPPDGTSEPFCNNPITLSAVTDLPDPLSPTRHSVSRSRTCSETPSITRSPPGLLPRLTTRLSMSRTRFDMIIALRRLCEERSDDAIHLSSIGGYGLLRFARNDVEGSSLPALPLLHAWIERVARGVANQVDAEDGDREQQAGPEDQRGFYLEIRAALGHDIAPGRRFRTDAGAEKRHDRVDPPEEARDETDHKPHADAEHRRAKPDQQRYPPTVQNPGKHVAAVAVGTEHELRGRGLQPLRRGEQQWIVRRKPGRQQRGQDHQRKADACGGDNRRRREKSEPRPERRGDGNEMFGKGFDRH